MLKIQFIMKYCLFLFLTMGLLSLSSCTKDAEQVNNDYVKGKNRFTTLIDGDEREYFVSVPNSYDGNTAFPVVFMLHGTGGDGERFYNISGWKELGEIENIITVFPSSWRYCIKDDGKTKNITKWNITPDCEWYFCRGETGKDDIHFLNTVISELTERFNIDSKRIYLVGFSNGGQMAAKCAIEMGNVLAAVAENAGSFIIDTIYSPVRKLPVLFQVGNEDFGPGVTNPPIELSSFDSLLQTPGNVYYRIKTAHVRNFGLDSIFTISGNNQTVSIADFHSQNSNETNVFKMVFVEGLSHQYPNGKNHWMNGAKVQWEWFKQYTLP